MSDRCEKCVYWRRHIDEYNKKALSSGDCCRNPPTATWVGNEFISDFPESDQSEWCGEFARVLPGGDRA